VTFKFHATPTHALHRTRRRRLNVACTAGLWSVLSEMMAATGHEPSHLA
jgi:hypothetical protein